MPDFVEVADRVWVARYEWVDVNVTAIGTERGLVVVDTHGSTAAGREVLSDLDRLGAGPITHVVNSHWHWDHTFGNAAFREAVAGIPIHAHEEAAAWLARHGDERKGRFLEPPVDPRAPEVMATRIVTPDHTFTDSQVLELGDRSIELAFPGRGHTSGDIVVRVADADVLIAGDLVEESANPWIGPDSWPLEWPATLDVVVEWTTPRTMVVPGHGRSVDRSFVRAQRDDLAQIAAVIRSLSQLGESAERLLLRGDWPWEVDDRIRHAVERGMAALSTGTGTGP